MTTEVLLITGAAGVGKSTACWEVSEHLKQRNLPHAVIDTDELDRVWPLAYDDDRRRRLNVRNLSSWWSEYVELGIERLVMAGVFLDLDDAVGWISEAIPGVVVVAVRLVVSDGELRRRVERREIGSGREDQLRRSLQQAAWIAAAAHADEIIVPTDDTTVSDLARHLCDLVGWTAAPL